MAATILVTGASGLIGFRILLAALDAGHNVRFTARSEDKARIVSSNPAVKKLGITTTATGQDRLSAVIIPDMAVDGAFDAAMEGVTHVIHTGSPVPVPFFDPVTQVYEPTIKMTAGLLKSALKSPSIKRVVITSSIVANIDFSAAPDSSAPAPSASTRIPPPSPIPQAFDNVMHAYIVAKLVEMRDTDALVQTQRPHFTVSHVVPGYVFGRNELALDVGMMQTQNSSNNFLMMGLLGSEVPFPLLGGFAHIDDVAAVHLRVALDDAYAGKDVGIATKIDYESVFGHVQDKYPKAVEAGVFKKGTIPTQPIEYDSSDAEALLGGLKSFETAVTDVAAQYLELLGDKTE